MAVNRWLGRAKAVAQVETITIGGTIAALDTFTVTINGKSITIAATNTSAATTAGLLADALNAETAPAEFAEVTWAADGATVVGTCDTAGLPFEITTTDSSGASTIGRATTTAATGPNHWDNVNNWSAGTAPAAGEEVYIDNSAVSILHALNQSGVALDELRIASSFTGTIGLPATNSGGYPEYRLTHLDIDTVLLQVGYGAGTGSGRIKLSTSSSSLVAEILSTGSPIEGSHALIIKDTHASSVWDIRSGSVGFATFGGNAAAIGAMTIGKPATVEIGVLATQAGNLVSFGTLTTYGEASNVYVKDGTAELNGPLPPDLTDVSGGTCKYNCSGTCTAVLIGPGTLDASNDLSARTFTATTLRRDGTLTDPGRTITHTGAIAISGVNEVRAA